mmetsp:Transcript_22620/g.48687  ORF Transcript_22620/g.48687 Transcript_22620/m.48687 type:complete len:330 (+) Transcript_22620:1048-2037(+)
MERVVDGLLRLGHVRRWRVRRAGQLRERSQWLPGVRDAAELLLDVPGGTERGARDGGGGRGDLVVRSHGGIVVLLERREGLVHPVGHHLVRIDLPGLTARGHHRDVEADGKVAAGERGWRRHFPLHCGMPPCVFTGPCGVLQQVGVRVRRPVRLHVHRGGKKCHQPVQNARLDHHHHRQPCSVGAVHAERSRGADHGACHAGHRPRGGDGIRRRAGGIGRGLLHRLHHRYGPDEHPHDVGLVRGEHRHRLLRRGPGGISAEPSQAERGHEGDLETGVARRVLLLDFSGREVLWLSSMALPFQKVIWIMCLCGLVLLETCRAYRCVVRYV